MYFDHLKTSDEIKNRYKLLAKRLHPDVGGDTVIMQEINTSYEKALKKLEQPQRVFVCQNRNKIESVLEWSFNNPSFDNKFVLSLLKRLDSGKDLSPPQEYALNNIIKKFKIEIKKES